MDRQDKYHTFYGDDAETAISPPSTRGLRFMPSNTPRPLLMSLQPQQDSHTVRKICILLSGWAAKLMLVLHVITSHYG